MCPAAGWPGKTSRVVEIDKCPGCGAALKHDRTPGEFPGCVFCGLELPVAPDAGRGEVASAPPGPPPVTPLTPARRLAALVWLLPAAVGAWQVGLLLYTVARRFLYPYDLEWMEGGLLVHALRYLQGHDIYAPPSVDFIPYLYTPLYPLLLAALGKLVGLSYQLGRAVSILSILAVMKLVAQAIAREGGDDELRPAALAAIALAAGFFAATYPWVEGWYDLVRADTLYLALGLGGLVALRAWAARPGTALAGFWHGRVALAASLLALTFFVKQTGVLLVAAGGAALLVLNWRAVPIYGLVAGAIGGGGTLLLDRLSGGWFWIYVFEYHQQHDTNRDRFWRSFDNILGHFPVLTAAVALGLVAVVVTLAARRRLPRGGAGFLYWTWLFACGVVMGALGWATQWAHFNAYIPAMLLGGIAAGCAVVVVAGAAAELFPGRTAVALASGGALALALAAQLVEARWSPRPFIPTASDRAAGDRLIGHIRSIPGEVFIPFHPWYARLAGKPAHTHRMGILDVTYTPPPKAGKRRLPARARQVAGLAEGLRARRWAAVFLDDRGQTYELPGLSEAYRREPLPGGESPRVVTGAKTVPRWVWLPKEGGPR